MLTMAPLINDFASMNITHKMEEIPDTEYENDTAKNDSLNKISSDKTTQYLISIIVTISAFSSGTFLAWTSSALPLLYRDDANIKIDEYQGSWVAALLSLGACFGAIPTGLIAEKFGRKKTLLSLAIPMMASWLLIALSTSVYCFYVGRLVGGVAVGAIGVAVPPYVAELAHPGAKDTLASFYQIQLAAGILFGYLAGLLQDVTIISLVSACVPNICFVAILFMPESPVYLMTQGKVKEARNSLLYIRGIGCDIDKELSRIKEYINDSISKEGRFKDLISTRSNIKALIIAFYLMIFQQLSGIIPIIFYMGKIFSISGAQMSPQYSCVVVAALQLASAFVFAKYFRDARRRPLLISTLSMMAVSLVVLGVYMHLNAMTDTNDYDWVPMICMAIFVGMYTMGIGPVPWTVMREIFPDNIKRRSIAISSGIGWFTAFVVSKYYQTMVSSIGTGWVLWNFGTACGIAALFIFFFVPETKGKTLEQIHKELNGNAVPRHKHIIEMDCVSIA